MRALTGAIGVQRIFRECCYPPKTWQDFVIMGVRIWAELQHLQEGQSDPILVEVLLCMFIPSTRSRGCEQTCVQPWYPPHEADGWPSAS